MRAPFALFVVAFLSACAALNDRALDDLKADHPYRSLTLPLSMAMVLQNAHDYNFNCRPIAKFLVSRDGLSAKMSYCVPGWSGESCQALVEMRQTTPQTVHIDAYAYVGTGFDSRPFIDQRIHAVTKPTECLP